MPVDRVQVAAAVIRDGDRIFATQRGYGEFKDWWEFPGGKIEPGETPEEALVREIKEELSADIHVGKLLHTVEWDYPKFHLTMRCYMCSLVADALHLNDGCVESVINYFFCNFVLRENVSAHNVAFVAVLFGRQE